MLFAEEKEKQVKTLDEVKEALNTEFQLDSAEMNILDLGMTEGYRLQAGKTEYEMTQRAFKGLLTRLSIPYRFGLAVPEDLLETIVRRLTTAKAQSVRLFTQEGVVYNITKGNFNEPDLLAILDHVTDQDLELGQVGTEGFRICTLGGSKLEVEVGDIVRFGLYLKGSHTGPPLPRANLMTYRLVCTNGVVVGSEWGEVHWSRRNGHSLEHFLKGLDELSPRARFLSDHVKDLTGRDVTDFEFSRLWRSLKKVVGGRPADTLMETDPEHRRLILQQVKVKRQDGSGPSGVEDHLAYDMFNRISAFANDCHGAQAERIRRITGSLLS